MSLYFLVVGGYCLWQISQLVTDNIARRSNAKRRYSSVKEGGLYVRNPVTSDMELINDPAFSANA